MRTTYTTTIYTYNLQVLYDGIPRNKKPTLKLFDIVT